LKRVWGREIGRQERRQQIKREERKRAKAKVRRDEGGERERERERERREQRGLARWPLAARSKGSECSVEYDYDQPPIPNKLLLIPK
jgi:hypothetical protein